MTVINCVILDCLSDIQGTGIHYTPHLGDQLLILFLVLQSSKLVTRPINQKISKGSEESRDGINPKTPSELFDITLVLGEEKLYTSRLILNFASPVWRKMLTSDFKEKSSSEIPLPEKSYQAVLEMLLCITPGINKHITRKWPSQNEQWLNPLNSSCSDFCILGYIQVAQVLKIISFLSLKNPR